MISAFAKGAQALDEPRYADAARGAANFIRRRMWDETRRVLLRRFREDAAIGKVWGEQMAPIIRDQLLKKLQAMSNPSTEQKT